MKALLLALLACASLAHATDLAGPASFTFFTDSKLDKATATTIDWDTEGATAEAFFAPGNYLCYTGDVSSVVTYFELLMFRVKEQYPSITFTGSLTENGNGTLRLEILSQHRGTTSTLLYSAVPHCVR